MGDEPLLEDTVSGGVNESEIDLYGDAENFDHLNADENLSDAPPGMEHHLKIESNENDDDLYNAVITERSSPNGNDSHNSSGPLSAGFVQHGITGSGTQQRKYSCYVGECHRRTNIHRLRLNFKLLTQKNPEFRR